MTVKLHLAPAVKLHPAAAVLYLALFAALAVALAIVALRHGGPVHPAAMKPAFLYHG